MTKFERASQTRIFKAVVFDKDGTLFDSEVVFRGIARDTASRFGFDLTDDIHDGFIGGTVDNTRRVLIEAFGEAFPFPEFHDICRAQMNEHHASASIPLTEGAREAIEHFSELGIPLGLATSARRPETIQDLGAAGLLKFFDVIVTRDDVVFPKPNAEPYLLAAEKLGVLPQECLAVEDSLMGATSAIAAGMITFIVPDRSRPQEHLSSLEATVLQGLSELPLAAASLTFSSDPLARP